MSSRTSDVGPRIFNILFAFAFLACLPSLVYGQLQKDAVKLFPRDVHPGVDTLIPYFTSKSLVKRDQWRLGNDRGDIELPQLGQPVELLYGEDRGNLPTSTDPFITTVQFVPANNRAILLLEEYLIRPVQGEGILQQVKCEGLSQEPGAGRVLLEMEETGQRVETFNQWLTGFAGHEEKELVVVTSDIMKGCGYKERKAFLLNAVDFEGTTTILNVMPIDWSEVYVKMSVEFGRLSKSSLTKRFDFGDVSDFFTSTVPEAVDKVIGDDDSESATVTPTGKPSSTPEDDDGFNGQGVFELKPDMKSRLQLYPLEGIKPVINMSLPFDIPFLPQEDGQNNENRQNPGLTVTCVNCTLTGSLAYEGKLDIDISGLESAFIELNVTKDLLAALNLEFATGDKPFQYEFQQSIFPPIGSQDGIPLPGFGILGILQIVPYFDYAIGASIEVGAPRTNVTVGGELRVPKGAFLQWDLVKDTSTQVGWDVDVTSFPARINEVDTGNFSLGLNFSSIPSVLMNLEVGSALPGSSPVQVGAKLAMILPRLYTQSTLVKNVTEACVPPGPEDYTYFPSGIAFESGIYTALVGELFALVDLPLGQGAVILSPGVEYTHTIWEDTFPFKDACFLFGDSQTGLGALRNASLPDAALDKVFDVKKIEDKFKQTGELPAGLDLERLSKVEGLPDDLKAVLVLLDDPNSGNLSTQSAGKSSPGNGNEGSNLRGSVWTVAIVAFGTAFF